MNGKDARDAIASALARIAPEADLAGVRPDERRRDALDLDSLDFMSLVDALRSRTGVAIPESDYPQLETLDQLVDYLVAHAGATSHP